MLILITTRCHEGCAHCMHDARPDGIDMSGDTLTDIIKFLKTICPMLIQISGGEPTLHPQFKDFTTRIAKSFKPAIVFVESNGSFISDPQRKQQVLEVLQLPNVKMQVRTHPQYYPNYEQTISNMELRMLHKSQVFNDCIRIFPIGRAANMPAGIKYRTCVNTYLLAAQKPHLRVAQLVPILQANMRFCSPMIDPNGFIHAGESIFCTSLGHVSSPKMVLETTPCGKCGLL